MRERRLGQGEEVTGLPTSTTTPDRTEQEDEILPAPRPAGRGRILRRVLAWSAGVIVLALVVGIVIFTTKPPPTRGGGNRLTAGISGTVSASPVARHTVSTSVSINGTVGSGPTQVTAAVSAPLATIAVHEGDHVRAGDVIATLTDVQGLAAQHAQAKASLAQAQSQLDTATAPPSSAQTVAQAQSQVDAAQTAVESAQASVDADQQAANVPGAPASAESQLTKDQDTLKAAKRQLSSAQSYLDAVKHPASAPQDQVDAASSAVTAAQDAVNATAEALDQLTVRAPADGTVTDITAQVGQTVTPTTPIAEISGSASTVTAVVSPQVAHQLRSADQPKASVRLAVSTGGHTAHGHVSYVAAAADPQTHQTDITIDIHGGNFAPGDPVHITVDLPLGRQTVVPSQSVVYDGGKAGVYVLTGILDPARIGVTLPASVPRGTRVATVVFTPVTVLAVDGNQTAVDAHLSGESQIVTTGQTSVTDHARVGVLPKGD